MNKKIKIVIAGIGGVGGYFGGLLAKHFAGSDGVAVYFIARGEHLTQIRAKGLKVIKGADSFMAVPALATDNAAEIGIADYVIVCTKSFDLEHMIGQLKPCIGKATMILPLQNGVDSKERISSLLPGTNVLQGCVYIVSQVTEPGVVENSGKIQSLFFGIDNKSNDQLLLLEKLFKEAGVEATLSDSISSIVWEKFIFISPIATASSYFDCTIGKLMEENENTVIHLVEEVISIALAKGIELEKDIVEKTLRKIKSMPYDATTSLHRDYRNKRQHTELESLAGYVVRAGNQSKIPVPFFETAYKSLKIRNFVS
jgi:2-dehydropantoate 2-reductase